MLLLIATIYVDKNFENYHKAKKKNFFFSCNVKNKYSNYCHSNISIKLIGNNINISCNRCFAFMKSRGSRIER